MKTSRRDFLKVSSVTGIGLASTPVSKTYDVFKEENINKKVFSISICADTQLQRLKQSV